jgi:uncharacterized protein (TIGR02444 family)
MNFPTHPFWDFSLSLYRKPGVADACLFVQDRYGLNVNLVLLCIWVADSGGGALSAVQMATAMRRIADWERQVIKPLREIRRACRREPLGIPEFLLQIYQPQIESAEIEAEHVEQLVLAEFARSLSQAEKSDVAARDAAQSLRAYVDELAAGQDEQLTECLSTILQAAFDGASFPEGAV